MIQAKCIQKFRDNSGKIYGYRLQDINVQTQDVTPEDLKKAILNKQVDIINLTLTSDGRLVDRKAEKQLENKKIMPNSVITPTDSKETKAKKPYDAKSYSEFIRMLIPLMEKTFKFSGEEKFTEGDISIDETTKDITWLCGCMGDFIYAGYNCYIEIDYSYDTDTKDGVLTYDVMIKGGDDSPQYSFKYEFDSLNMKAHFSKILKETQKFIYYIMNNWKHV